MKKTFFLFIAFVAIVSATSLAQQTQRVANITFKEYTHNYDTVAQGSDGICEFTFTNTGDAPLLISDAKASCGCVVPSWSKKPIMPGKSGAVKVQYNTEKPGEFRKTIVVYSNAKNSPKAILRVVGYVKRNQTASKSKK